MVLIHSQGQGLCLECHERFRGGDEAAWLERHLGPDGCSAAGDADVPVSGPRS
jgi:hypothetical protein